MTWTDATTSDTTTDHNSSKFITPKDVKDGTGGIDFILTFTEPASWTITDDDPITLSDTTRNDPAY